MTTQNSRTALFQLIFSILFIIAYIAVFFLLAGDWFWIKGWIFNISFGLFSLISIFYLYYKNPELLNERFKIRGQTGQKGWDKYFISTLLIIYTIWFVIIPLDARRFAWSANFPLWLEILGGIMLLIFFFFSFRVLADNPFLAPVIRIQQERKQYVVSTGIYGFVRHPMYLGSIFMFIGIPLFLGSFYGILSGIALSLMLVARIAGEEKMLEEELEGYKDYKQKVKYRLIPFVW